MQVAKDGEHAVHLHVGRRVHAMGSCRRLRLIISLGRRMEPCAHTMALYGICAQQPVSGNRATARTAMEQSHSRTTRDFGQDS